jgi:hypothetical protein
LAISSEPSWQTAVAFRKAFEQKFRQRAVAGAEIQNRDRLLFLIGNRGGDESKSFLTTRFFLILPSGPIRNVVCRCPVMGIVIMAGVITVMGVFVVSG